MDVVRRGQERYRKAFGAFVAATGSRGVSLVASLITVPLTAGYLGEERFGLWMLFNGLAALLTFADLGIGNALMNAVAELDGLGRLRDAREKITSAIVILFGVAGVLLVTLIATFPVIDWTDLFHVRSPQARSELGPAMLIFALAFIASLPLGIVRYIQLGYQQGARANLWQLGGASVGFVAIVAAAVSGAGVPVLVACYMIPPLLALALNAIWWLARHPDLRPSLRVLSRSSVGSLAPISSRFFVLQIAFALSYSVDTLVLARVLGPHAVGEYGVVHRLFLLLTLILGLMFAPLWPAYREAIARGDIEWTITAFSRSFRLSLLLGVVGGIALLFLGPAVIELWVGERVDPPLALFAGFSVWTVLAAGGAAVSVLLNAAELIRFQILVAVAATAINLPLSIYLAQRVGVSGVVWATVAADIVAAVIPYAIIVPRLLARLNDARLRAGT